MLRALEPNSYTMIDLSMWLGLVDPQMKNLNAELLRNKAAFEALKDKLAEIGVLAPGKYRYPNQRLPGPAQLASARNGGHFTGLAGAGPKYIEHRVKGGPADTDEPLYRITQRSYGPFFFSQQGAKAGSGGRFDIASTMSYGTMYLAETVEGAVSEVYERILVLDVQALTTKLLWEMRNADDLEKLLDLTDPTSGAALGGVATSAFTTMNRVATQRLATDAQGAGYSGIIYSLKTTVSKGFAIFGPAGATYPDSVGLGSWSCRARSMAESEAFWDWVKNRSENSSDSMHIILNQMPFERLLPK
jgi:hypothetical protein